MINSKQYFELAQLAEASYANLENKLGQTPFLFAA